MKENFRNNVEYINPSEIIVFLLCFVSFIVLPFFIEPIILPKIIVIAIITIIMLVLFIFFRSEYKLLIPVPLKLLFIYLISITITLSFSTYIWRSLVGHSTRLEGYFVLLLYGALMILTAFFYRPQLWHFKLYLICASLMSLHAIFIRYESLFGIDSKTTTVLFFKFTGCGNQNFLGSYMALAFPVAVYYVLKCGKKAYIPAGFIYSGLLVSNTRGAWIGACVALVAMVIIYWKEPGCRQRILALGGLFVAITALYFFTSATFKGRFQSFSSVTARGFIYHIVWELIKMRPLTGWGIETLDLSITENPALRQEVINQYHYYAIIDKAHCEILQVAVSSGIPAAIAFVGTQVSTVVHGIRRFEKWAPWTPLLFSIGAYMIAALWNISSVNVAPVFWIFCGMVLAMTRGGEDVVKGMDETLKDTQSFLK